MALIEGSSDRDIVPWQRNPARCRLCRYPLELGDMFVNAGAPNESPQPYGFHEYRHEKVHEQQREFCGREEVWPDIVRYHGDCSAFATAMTFCCGYVHSTRYDLVPPACEDDRRRSRTQYVLARRLQTVIMPEAKLPLEIWIMVAEQMVRECAIVQMQTLWDKVRLHKGSEDQIAEDPENTTRLKLKLFQGLRIKLPLDRRPEAAVGLPVRRSEYGTALKSMKRKKEIRPTKGVWAYYMYIDGIRYIAKLTNNKPKMAHWTPREAEPGLSGQPVMLLDPSSGSSRTKTVAHILYNHLGVRQVIFAHPESQTLQDALSAHASTPGSWWKCVSTERFKTVAIVSDGLKIGFCSENTTVKHYNSTANTVTSSPLNTSWITPMTASDVADVQMFSFGITRGMYSRCKELFMNAIDCNAPDVVGYSIMYASSNICTLLAHHGEREAMRVPPTFYRGSHFPSPSFEEWYPPKGVWVYFPLERGEYITHILSRRGIHSIYMALIFLTNKGRPLIMAPALNRRGRQQQQQHLIFDDDEMVDVVSFCSLPMESDNKTPASTKIFYNVSTRGIRQIGVQHAQDLHSPMDFPAFLPEPPSPNPALSLPTPSISDVINQHPDATRIPNYFYSAADLEGAVCIIPYRGPERGGFDEEGVYEAYSVQIAGLMIDYGENRDDNSKRPRRACLGECRLDMAEPTLELALAGSGSTALHLGFVKARLGAVPVQPYMTRVEIDDDIVAEEKRKDAAGNGQSLFWLDVPWKAAGDDGQKLEWWFTYGHCKVISADGESPSFRVATVEDDI